MKINVYINQYFLGGGGIATCVRPCCEVTQLRKDIFFTGKDQTFLEPNVNGSIGTCELSRQNQQVPHVFRAKL
jgi:hypothetical protein